MYIDFFINNLINEKLNAQKVFVASYNTNNTIRCFYYPRIKKIVNQSHYCYFVKRNGYFRVFSEVFDKVYSFTPGELIKKTVAKAKKYNYKVLIYVNNSINEERLKESINNNVKIVYSNGNHQELNEFLQNNKYDILLFDVKEEYMNDFLLKYLPKLNCSLLIDVQNGVFELINGKQSLNINKIKKLFGILFKKKKEKLLNNSKKNAKYNKKCFVAGYYYIPQTTAQAISTFKILKNSKFKYDVYSSKNRNWCYNTDSMMNIFDTPNINAIYSDFVDGASWCEETANYFLQNKDSYEFLMTRVMPDWSHNVGLMVKEKYPDVFWIASFGDPLYNNPIELQHIANNNFDKKTAKRILNNLNLIYNSSKEEYKCFALPRVQREKCLRIFELVNLMIFNNKYQMQWVLGEDYDKYKDKCYVLSHSFDPDFYIKRKIIKQNNKIKFLYLGHTDSCRNINSFIDAINRIKKDNKEFLDKIEIIFVGNIYEETINKIQKYKLDNILHKVDNMDYLSSLDLMEECDVLLLADAKLSFMKGLNVFFASKLSDYLGSKKLILGLCDNISPTRDVIKNTNNLLCDVDNIEDIKNTIIRIINNNYPRIKYSRYKE